MKNVGRLPAALILFSISAMAQDPLDLIKKVAANYLSLHKTTYDFEQVEVQEDLGESHHCSERRTRSAATGACLARKG